MVWWAERISYASRSGAEAVMRDPGRICVAHKSLALLAEAGKRGADAVHLPPRRLGQIADRGTAWPLEKS